MRSHVIYIKNTQRTIPLNQAKVKRQVKSMLSALKYDDFDISIWFTTNETIRKYNKRYRHKDAPTDILSFPYYPSLKPGEKIAPESEEDKNLGDIIISLAYMKKDAPKWKQSFSERLEVLLCHGIAHLLGHDHQTDEEYKVMQVLERKLLKAIRS